MSVWTHVVGCIRVDGLPTMGDSIEKIEKVFGPMCLWDKWDESSILPRGSEGSLEYRIIEYDNGLSWVVIPIWGDLRDYDDVKAIGEWWIRTLLQFDIIRDAVLRVDVEGQEPIIFKWG